MKEEPQADHNSEPEIEVPAVATMTALSMDYINQLEEENQHLREENHSLKDVIAKQEMHEHSFRDNPTKVKFYTGLPSFATLMVMFEFVAPYVPSTRCVLPMQFLMVLMKLRLNLADQDWHIGLGFINQLFQGTLGSGLIYSMTDYILL